MADFYNDNDHYVAQWLGNLIAIGHLPQGTVDARSILDIDPEELRPFRQCHFFAGIGGWAYALQLAGWPADREVWTGSCPCQPLSSAGQRRGHADERHLWPAFYRLIAERRPAALFGEQVASKDGREWLAGVRADLEALGYAVGAADLPVASVGAPHIRQRLFWVADSDHGRRGPERQCSNVASVHERSTMERSPPAEPSAHGGLADAPGIYGERHPDRDAGGGLARSEAEGREQLARRDGASGGLADADGGQSGGGNLQPGGKHRQQPQDGGVAGGMGDATGGRCEEPPQRDGRARQSQQSAPFGADTHRPNFWPGGGLGDTASERGREGRKGRQSGALAGLRDEAQRNHWQDAEWLPCLDGKARRIEPGTFPLAHGVPARVGRLRAYGNAIVAPLAAEFVRAFLDG